MDRLHRVLVLDPAVLARIVAPVGDVDERDAPAVAVFPGEHVAERAAHRTVSVVEVFHLPVRGDDGGLVGLVVVVV